MEHHETVAIVMELYAAAFCSICFAWYVGRLLPQRFRFARIVVAAVYAALRFGLPRWIGSNQTDSGPTILRMFILLAASFLLLAACYRNRWRLKVYICVSWSAIFELSFFLSYTVLFAADPIYDSIAETLMRPETMDLDRYLNAMLSTAYVFQVLMSILLTALCLWSCRGIVDAFPHGRRNLTRPEFRLLIFPAVIGLLMGILLRMLVITVADGVPMLLFDRYQPLKVVVPSLAFIADLSIVYAVRTFRGMVDLEEERRGRLVAERQLVSLKELVQDSERMNGNIRRMRHDLHNTLTVIQALSENVPEGEALHTYLSDLNGELETLERPFRTGDPVADALLASKYHELKQICPVAIFDADGLVLPAEGSVSSYDLGILLGNALDNALQALKAQKEGEHFVSLRSFRHENLLFITVENSVDTQPVSDSDGLPQSTKGEGHGIGLYNIRSIASKYNGTMDWKADGRIFTLSIMIEDALPGQ